MCLAGWFGLNPSAHAATTLSLDEYRERIKQATLAVDSLLYPDEEENGRTDAVRAEQAAEVIRFVRNQIASVEAVTWENRRFVPNNSWVYERLDAYEQGANLPAASRREILRSLAERLQSLNEQLAEAAAGNTSNDPEIAKRRLASVLQRPEYNEEKGRGSAFAELWRRFVEWFWSLFPKASPGYVPTNSRVTQIIVILIVLTMVAIALWKLLSLARRQKYPTGLFSREARTVLGERLRSNQRASDLFAEAEALARAGSLREAIRKGYIAFLCELGERRILALADHKTNRDYLEAVRSRHALLAEMQRLTAIFESHWYGDRPAPDTAWSDFRQSYDRALANNG